MSFSFFEPMIQLGKEVQWTYTFIIDAEGYIKGSCSQRGLGLNSKLLNTIHPLRFEGTAGELDNGLLAELTAPVKKVIGLVQNISTHEKTVAVATKRLEDEKAKAAQKATTKTEAKTIVKPPEKDARTKKYELLMKRVDDLEKENKPGQALTALCKITEYPEKTAEITAKANALRAKRGDLDLFGSGASEQELPRTTSHQEASGHSGADQEGEESEEPQDPGPWEDPAGTGDDTGLEEEDEGRVLTQADIEE